MEILSLFWEAAREALAEARAARARERRAQMERIFQFCPDQLDMLIAGRRYFEPYAQCLPGLAVAMLSPSNTNQDLEQAERWARAYLGAPEAEQNGPDAMATRAVLQAVKLQKDEGSETALSAAAGTLADSRIADTERQSHVLHQALYVLGNAQTAKLRALGETAKTNEASLEIMRRYLGDESRPRVER